MGTTRVAQPIEATEITFDIGDKAIECLGRASAAVELAARKPLRLGCLVRAATSWFRWPFGRASRQQLGGISGEFSSIPVTRSRYPDNEQRIATRRAERDPAYHRKAETIPRGGGYFFYRK